MSFLVIDTNGALSHRTEKVGRDTINGVMPGGWFDLVRLPKDRSLYGFVDDSGHINGLPRNPVGSAMLVALGAPAYPYAGPVVITGWQEPDEATELRDLTAEQVQRLTGMHRHIGEYLEGREPRDERQFAQHVRAYVEWVKTADAPPVTVMELGERL